MDRFINGKSVRAIASEQGVHRRLVRQALNEAVPVARKSVERVPRVLTVELRAVIERWLLADRDAPRKQRHTARRITARLRSEHKYVGAESTVRRRVPEGGSETIGALWQKEKALLRVLPAGSFDAAEVTTPQVDKMGRIRVSTNHYSVPVRLAHLRVEARLGALCLEVRHEGRLVAAHVRLQGTYGEKLDLDHYLELLLDKPGALARSRPLRQSRDEGRWPADYDRVWTALKERWGDAQGTRELVKVLMLHREEHGELVHVAVGLALEYGCCDAGAISTLLRQLVTGDRKVPPLGDLGALARYERPAPDLCSNDQLLSANLEVH